MVTTIIVLTLLVLAACAPTQAQIDRVKIHEAKQARLLWPELSSIDDKELGDEIWRCLVQKTADSGREVESPEAVGVVQNCFVARGWLQAKD